MVLPICCVTKIAFSRQREQERDPKWISGQILILRPMSYIQFPLPRFTFQQKAAAPLDPKSLFGQCHLSMRQGDLWWERCVNWAQTAIQYPRRKPLPAGLKKRLRLSESLPFIL